VPLYSAGRRRIILLLLLTSVLLVTIDLRGNAVFDAARSGFAVVFSPLESAAEVITRPVTDAWRGITEYDDLVAENQRLQQQIDAQRGAEIAARNALVENQQLLALNDLESVASLPSVTAKVVGRSPNNLDQTIEIDRGSDDKVEVGMAVVNEAGLVGKVTRVTPQTSIVMLVTDPSYTITVKILAEESVTPTTSVESTVPSGIGVDDLASTTTTVPTTTAPPIVGGTPIGAATTTTSPPSTTSTTVAGATTVPPGSSTTSTSTSTTSTTSTTTPPIVVDVETGAFEGRGANRLPRVTFVADNPRFGRPQVGDTVHTTGGSLSLAPPDIPVGVVRNVITNPGSVGTVLEVETAADVSSLQFVRVILYKPPVEVGG
jgi:rod shape-determining protein MreC